MRLARRVGWIGGMVALLLALPVGAAADGPLELPERPVEERPAPPDPETFASRPSTQTTSGTVAGTVVAEGTGDPLADIDVRVYSAFFGTPIPVAVATTAADGTYTTAVAPGQYRVEFSSVGEYPGEFFDDQPTFASAHAVAVFDGATTTLDATLAKGTPVSGTVRSPRGNGVPAFVRASPTDGGRLQGTTAAADGSYSFAGLRPGTYSFQITAAGFRTYTEQVVVGGAPLTVDARLRKGGAVAGTVTDSSGAAVEGARVAAYNSLRRRLGNAATDAAGTYRIDGLDTGPYFVEFRKDSQLEWHGSTEFQTADRVQVDAGATTVVDHAFGPTGSIAGRVTSAADGTPLSGIEVRVVPLHDLITTATTVTGSNGRFDAPGLAPGRYRVIVQSKEFAVGTELDDPVTVVANATTNVKAALATGGTVRGTLVDRATGGTVPFSIVDAVDPRFRFVAEGLGFGGEYLIEGVTAGAYRLLDFFFNDVYPTTWHDGKRDFNTADPVVVTAEVETVLTSTVDPGPSALSGRIVDAATGQGIPGATVTVFNGPFFIFPSSASTAGDGTFILRGLPAGEHRVSAAHPDYEVLYLGPTPTTEAQLAGTLTFEAGKTTTANGALSPSARITAVVTRAADGARVPTACITLVDEDLRNLEIFGTARSGAFERSVTPGTYQARVANCFDDTDSLAPQWIGGSSEATATAFTVAAGRTVDLSTALATGGSIRGRVTDAASGAPLEGVCVDAFAVGSRTRQRQAIETGADGRYQIGNLGHGPYQVRVFDCRLDPQQRVTWYGGSMSRRAATPITVPAGGTVGGQDIAMARADVTTLVVPPNRAGTTGGDATGADPVVTSLTFPYVSIFTLSESSAPDPVPGFDLFAAQVGSSEFVAHPLAPHLVAVELDASLVGGTPPARIVALHEGVPLPACVGAGPVTRGCVDSITIQPDGDVVVSTKLAYVGDLSFGARREPTVGLFDPATARWHLRRPGSSPLEFAFGDPGDVPLFGDWDCDGVDTPGVYRPTTGRVYLRNSNTTGVADRSYGLGDFGDVPLAGDFDGDGCDTVSMYRPANQRVYVFDGLANGIPDAVFVFGNPGDTPIAGDFDGDGVDTLGLHRPTTGRVYFRNSLTTGVADADFVYGDPGDRFVVDDWNGDGVDSPGIFRPADARFYLRNTNTSGVADRVISFGEAPWLPVSGFIGG